MINTKRLKATKSHGIYLFICTPRKFVEIKKVLAYNCREFLIIEIK